jgi:hypothetical protein
LISQEEWQYFGGRNRVVESVVAAADVNAASLADIAEPM